MMPSLPRYMVLKSKQNQAYVGYHKGQYDVNGRLSMATNNQAVSPFAKLEVERVPSIGNLHVVRIRCCYNNKYWVMESGHGRWIKAAANEGDENWFQPIQVSDSDPEEGIRFRHMRSLSFVRRSDMAPYFLCATSFEPDATSSLSDVFTIVDWESLVVLPKHVAFKGDNGKYLRVIHFRHIPFLQFSSDDFGDPAALHEVITNRDGSVRIKSGKFGKFWRRSPNWIWADSDLDNNQGNKDMMFWPVKLGEKVIALKNLGNNWFCKRLTDFWVESLNAGVPTITREAQIEVQEVVVSRSIENVDFRLSDARIYDQKIKEMVTGEALNDSQQPNTVDLKFSYKTSTTRTFNSSVSFKASLTTSFGCQIPAIGLKQKVELAVENATGFGWGKSVTEESHVETVYQVTVPPMSRVKVSLMASQGSCDVPFSYTQRDTLIDGNVVRINMDDGIYTGVNCYNFKYETKQESLGAAPKQRETRQESPRAVPTATQSSTKCTCM